MFNTQKYTTWIIMIILSAITSSLAAYFVQNNYEYEKRLFVKKLNEILYSTIINYGNYKNGINNFPLRYKKYIPVSTDSIQLVGNNIIANPDFELGDTLFNSDYDAFSEKGIGIFYNNNGWRAVVNNALETHGTWAGRGYKDNEKFLLLDGSTLLNAYAWKQQVNVTPNTSYQLSFVLSSLAIFKNPETIKINRWQLADLAIYINDECIGRCTAPDTAGRWQKNIFYWYADSARTAHIKIKNLNTGNCYNDFAIDAVSFRNISTPKEYLKQDTGYWLSPIHTETIDSTAIIEIFANEIKYNKLPSNTILSIADLRSKKKNIYNDIHSDIKPNESTAYHEHYHTLGKTLFTRYYYAYAGYAIRCQANDYNIYLFKRISALLYSTLLLSIILLLLIVVVFRYIQKKQQMKTLRYQLSNNITHELKTPVSTIMAAADGLKYYNDTGNKQKLNEYIDIARAQAAKLNDLINNAMKLVDEQRADVVLKKQNILLHTFLSTVAAQAKQSHNVSIQIQCPRELSVYADAFHLNNVLSTILDNSIKYCKIHPQIVIDVTTSGKKIIMSIKDNGIGIPAAYHRHVFKKHYRAPVEEVNTISGHGLGLSYVALIMQLHKGKAAVKSNGKEGTTIILTFRQ